MFRSTYLLILLFVSSLTSSCNSYGLDDDGSFNYSSSKITSFVFDTNNGANKIIEIQPTIYDYTKEIIITVANSATDDDLKALIPTITTSLDANVTPGSEQVAYFSFINTTKYNVTSQDRTTTTEYSVTCRRAPGVIGDEFNNVFFKGKLNIFVEDAAAGNDIPQKIFITKVGVNLLKMELNDFYLSGRYIGNIIVDKIAVVKTGNNHTLSGFQRVNLPLSPDPCSISVVGTINDNVLEMDITVVAPQTGTVLVHFKGSKVLVDESSESMITSFNIVDTYNIIHETPIIDKTNITFYVKFTATQDQLEGLIPIIETSNNATIYPESGVAQDFRNPITYTVTSEDGIYVTKYRVSLSGSAQKEHFNSWEYLLPNNNHYSRPLGWATTNYSIIYVEKLIPNYIGSAAVREASGSLSIGAEIITADTKGVAPNASAPTGIPKIMPGALFSGYYLTSETNLLKSSKFGIHYNRQPQSISGFYTYIPGADYYVCDKPTSEPHIAHIDPNKTDSCSIIAVLYEVTDLYEGLDPEDTKKYTQHLTIENILTSNKIVAIASRNYGIQETFEEFNLEFEYVQNYSVYKKYRLAIAFLSSKEGSKYSGAPDSALTVDEVQIVNK